MARRYVMTPRRKAALRKAQLISARKRRNKGRANKAKKYVKKYYRQAAVAGVAAAGIGATFLAGRKHRNARNVHGRSVRGVSTTAGGIRVVERPIQGMPNVDVRRKSKIDWKTGHPVRTSGPPYIPRTSPTTRRATSWPHQPLIDPNEDIAIALRERKNVIGSVRTAHGAQPRVHVGPMAYTKRKGKVVGAKRRVNK